MIQRWRLCHRTWIVGKNQGERIVQSYKHGATLLVSQNPHCQIRERKSPLLIELGSIIARNKQLRPESSQMEVSRSDVIAKALSFHVEDSHRSVLQAQGKLITRALPLDLENTAGLAVPFK